MAPKSTTSKAKGKQGRTPPSRPKTKAPSKRPTSQKRGRGSRSGSAAAEQGGSVPAKPSKHLKKRRGKKAPPPKRAAPSLPNDGTPVSVRRQAAIASVKASRSASVESTTESSTKTAMVGPIDCGTDFFDGFARGWPGRHVFAF